MSRKCMPSMGVIEHEIDTQFDYPLLDATKVNLQEMHDFP